MKSGAAKNSDSGGKMHLDPNVMVLGGGTAGQGRGSFRAAWFRRRRLLET